MRNTLNIEIIRAVLHENEDFEQRCLRRLTEELGVNPEGAEVILRMRKQITDLQEHIRELEDQVSTYNTRHSLRIAHYTETCYEAIWVEGEED